MPSSHTARRIRNSIAASCLLVVAVGCSSDAPAIDTTTDAAGVATTTIVDPAAAAPDESPIESTVAATVVDTAAPAADSAPSTFTAEVWADNWFSLSVNGEPVGEDSVPITTERSFNSETIAFTASYPLTIAIVSKDYKETDSGLEYIGTDRQQMGDGGLIAQITDTSTGRVVATTSNGWRGLVVHTAPTNPECVDSDDPDTDCASVILEEPAGWSEPGYDDSGWTPATVYTADEVGAKDGYLDITWDPSAALIWSSSLTQDNTILWRTVIEG